MSILHISQVQVGYCCLDIQFLDFQFMDMPFRSACLNCIEYLLEYFGESCKSLSKKPVIIMEVWTTLAEIWQIIYFDLFCTHLSNASFGRP